MRLFLDTSALVKRYRQEAGSAEVRLRLEAATALGLSVLTMSELISAFRRWLRERGISAAQYAEVKQRMLDDWPDCAIVGLTDTVVAHAVRLLEQHPLRSADALQIACARAWATDLFLSADQRQCAAARAEGLAVEELNGAVP